MIVALDVAIGLIFFYALISLLCTGINEFIAGVFRLRARTLHNEISKLIDNDEIRSAFWNSGLVRALCRDCSDFKYVGPEGEGSVGPKEAPSYMDSSVFAIALQRAISDTSDPDRAHEKLSDLVPEDSFLKSAVTEIEIAVGGGISDIRKGLADMFDAAMERTNGVYRRIISSVSLAVALIVVAILNADTIQLAQTLSKEDVLREQCEAIAQDH